jgi:predicted PurR-regulated permease PerM
MKLLGNRPKTAAFLLTAGALLLIAIPGFFLVSSAVTSINDLKTSYDAGTLHVPPAPDNIKQWPLIGQLVHETWDLASSNFSVAIERYRDQLVTVGTWLAGVAGKLGFGLLKFIMAILMAGILLVYSNECRRFTHALFDRLFGEAGSSMSSLADKTVRNVARGIIGVAFVQAVAAGLGFYLGGIPFAGLLTIFCLLLCVVQVGISIIGIPVIIYSYSHFSVLHATLLSVWLVIIMFSDNILKPIFLRKGAPVPTLIIFLGSLGGFLLSGIIGLFTGAVIFSLGYRLFFNWIGMDHTSSQNSPSA